MSWMSKLAKKNENTPKTQKNTNLLKTKRTLNIEMSAKWSPIFTFSLPGGRLASLPSVSYATVQKLTFQPCVDLLLSCHKRL